jgi:hypothetical protein
LRRIEIISLAFGGLLAPFQIFEKRRDRPSKLRKAYIPTPPVEERSTELFLEHLDRPRQRGLRDPTALCGAREMKLIAQREKVADLMHLHVADP